MRRNPALVISIGALAVGAACGYLLLQNDAAQTETAASAPTATLDTAAASAEVLPDPPSSPQEPAMQGTATGSAHSQDAGALIEQAGGTDPKLRASAIMALADAPRERAIPALSRILDSGEPELDRQLAIQSLHKIALQDGDADGKVREVLRSAVYHNDDENTSQSAQASLEDIEAELAARPASEN